MFIIRNKTTKDILFESPLVTPPQSPEVIYPEYDKSTMEWGWSERSKLAQHYKITTDNKIQRLSVEELVEQDLLVLTDREKIEDGLLVAKTHQELFDQGLLSQEEQVELGFLKPTDREKVVDNKIVPKTTDELHEQGLLTVEEQIANNFIILENTQKLLDGKIVNKTNEELLAEGLLTLQDNEKIVDGEIVEKSLAELIAEGLHQLSETDKLVNGEVVPKTQEELFNDGLLILDFPYEYAKDNEILTRTLEEAIEQGCITNLTLCLELLNRVNQRIDARIAEKYAPGYEVKIAKAYTTWLDEKTSATVAADDTRPVKFHQMEAYIESVKDEIKPLKEQVKALLVTFEQPIDGAGI